LPKAVAAMPFRSAAAQLPLESASGVIAALGDDAD
jgi:hypothetical protein